MRIATLILFLIAIAPAAEAASAPPFEAPATFAGTIPCADCPGIRETITFERDGGYTMRLDYLERRVAPQYERGRWTYDADAAALVLRSGSRTTYLRVNGGSTITVLDRYGDPIPMRANLSLTRTAAGAPRTRPETPSRRLCR